MKRKTLHYLIWILLFCVLFLNFRADSAIAHDDDDDGVDDDFEALNEREIYIEFDEDEIVIETVLRTGEVRDEIDFELSNSSDGFTVGTEYPLQ